MRSAPSLIWPPRRSIGDNVSIGHNAAIHGCTVEDNCIIGIGAIILSGAAVKRNSIVAPGFVVLMDQIVGPLHLVAGVPAPLKRGHSPEDTAHIVENARIYAELARKYLVKDMHHAPGIRYRIKNGISSAWSLVPDTYCLFSIF
jgi:carbonic anhydrase/acetyltransferase-like protein (isoleucine patch superfamily)